MKLAIGLVPCWSIRPRSGMTRAALAAALVWPFLLPLAAHAQLGQPKPPAPPVAKPEPGKAVKPAAEPAAPAVTPKVEKPPVKPPAKPERPKTEDTKEEAPPEPERMFLDTKDGWKIHCLYYGPKPKVKKGKEVVPVIAIHGWGGQGGEYDFLARQLQLQGHAVMVPDLRGHGRSTTRRFYTGDMKTIKYTNLTPKDAEAMVGDLEAVKKFLVQKNNEGEVNIELLALVAAESGCIVALNWAILDWSWPVPLGGKQGQDVKAVVLLTPALTYKGQIFNQKLIVNPPISNLLSIMIAVGEKDKKGLPEATRLHSRLEKLRPLSKDPEEAKRKKDLFIAKPDTNLAGTQLLVPQLPVHTWIAGFLHIRLVLQRDNFPWAERRSVLGVN
jgi:pimeloyl-ACP methyl ester carboxylesterase